MTLMIMRMPHFAFVLSLEFNCNDGGTGKSSPLALNHRITPLHLFFLPLGQNEHIGATLLDLSDRP